MNVAMQELERCTAFYQSLEGRDQLRETSHQILLLLESLQDFAKSSVKRCKEKHLEAASQLLTRLSRRLWELDREDMLPLVCCIFKCQMETATSSSLFCRLEKIVGKLLEQNETLVSEELRRLMDGLIEDEKPASSDVLQTVCLFIEESSLGRQYWKKNLMKLLQTIAATFDLLLRDSNSSQVEWHYVTIKVCLHLFKGMSEEIQPLVWDETDHREMLQKILRSLVHTIMDQSACQDNRLLAGTTVSMMVNTAAEVEAGAKTIWAFYLLLNLKAQRTEEHEGGCQFGALWIPASILNPGGLETLVMTRGLLTCCKKEILTCLLDGTPPKCLLLDVLFPAVLDVIEDPTSYPYYSYQVFSLWLQRVRESLGDLWKVKESLLLDDNSKLLQKLNKIVWNNAESPTEGVTDFVHSSFRILLEIYSLECDRFGDPERALFREYLQKVIFMPWEARARYFALSAILPYLGPQKVLEIYPDLPQHLFNCLSTNRLCPIASDLYKTLLGLQRKAWTEVEDEVSEEHLAHEWSSCWLPTFSSALTSSDPFLQSNTSSHLLGRTLRVFPATYTLLATRFGGRDASQLRAWVSLLNVQKTLAGDLLTDEETLKRLTCCLFSKEETVRLAALGFLCSAPKTSQVLSEREIRLLKEFLPLNLSCDSSSFRQLLQATVKKALVRMRDSSLAALRKRKVNQKESLARKDQERGLLQAVDFVNWLLQLCTASLMSGSNYQGKKTALLLLAAILETFTDTWRPERKKGQPPRNMATLLCWSRNKGSWDFFSTGNTLALLNCLQDSTNEIRGLASELLNSYFPPDLPASAAVALFGRALEAISSPRVQDSEAGAALMKSLLPKLDRHILKPPLLETEKEPSMPCKYLSFLEHLLNMLQNHFVTASRDLLLAAHTAPIHGVILAIRRCLLEEPEVVSSMLEAQKMPHWRLLFQRLVRTVRDISNLLLSVLQSHQASSIDQHASSPSFADMGNAIGSLIRLGKGLEEEEEEEDTVLLSEDHSLILTCCWVSIKEIGLLLGGLAEKVLPQPVSAGCEPLLPLRVVHVASKVFQDILLKCRHWGAVEGCSTGFTQFCTTLLNHPSRELQNIPRTMLTQGLALLSSSRGSSITRRAAGFPMLFLCIVTGEDPATSRPLLTRCIQTLLALASQPISHSSEQTVDLPQVSAVHVLQTLVRGSNLGPALQPHITPLMVLVLQALSSPSWAMRNAANQLFGALSVRLLGQKWSPEDSRAKDGVSPEALFGRHVHLRSVLLGELTLAVEVSVSEGPRRGKFHLCPSLYAVLTFLAKLQPSGDTQDSTLTCFLEPLIQLSGNPIYAVRAMAAKALVPFIPVTDYGKILLRLAARFPRPEATLSHNALHGCLLQIEAVLNQALRVDRLHPELRRSVACMMESHLWLLMDLRRCPLICAVYLQILSLLLGSCSPGFVQKVWELLRGDLASPKPGFSPIQLGSSIFCQRAVNFLNQEATRQESPERIRDLSLLLQKGNPDVQAAILTCLLDNEERKGLKSSKDLELIFMEKFKEILKNTKDPTVVKLYLKVFVYLLGNLAQSQPFPEKVALEYGEILLSMAESDQEGPGLRNHALCAATLFLSQQPEGDPVWERWIATIEKWSDSLSDEVLRVAAAKAIKMGGPAWIWRVRKSSHFFLRSQVPRLIKTAIHLLQDEDQEVRHEAASFVSCLVQAPSPVQQAQPHHTCLQLQSSKALLSLLEFLLENFGDHPSTFASLMHLLPTVELSDTLMELESQRIVNLYKEDEPNVYTEPAVFSQMLLPFLLQLVENASASRKLWESVQSWLETTAAGIVSTIQFCRQWWSQEDIPTLHLKALSCPNVHSAIAALLVKAILAAHTLKILETQNQPDCTPAISLSSEELSCTIHSLKDLLHQRGIVIMVQVEQEQARRQETS